MPLSRGRELLEISRKQDLLSCDKEIIKRYHEKTKVCFLLVLLMCIRDQWCHASMHRWCHHNCSNLFKMKMSDQEVLIVTDQHTSLYFYQGLTQAEIASCLIVKDVIQSSCRHLRRRLAQMPSVMLLKVFFL